MALPEAGFAWPVQGWLPAQAALNSTSAPGAGSPALVTVAVTVTASSVCPSVGPARLTVSGSGGVKRTVWLADKTAPS